MLIPKGKKLNWVSEQKFDASNETKLRGSLTKLSTNRNHTRKVIEKTLTSDESILVSEE